MLKLLKTFLSQYGFDASPVIPGLIFLLIFLILRLFFMMLATSELKNLPKDIKKQLMKHFHERALVGWVLWLLSVLLPIGAYYEFIPLPFREDIYLWPAVAILFLLSFTAHFLALAQAAIQTMVEKKSISLVG